MLSHFDLELPIELSSEKVNVLVYEDPEKFYRYSRELIKQSDGEDGGFSIYDGNKEIGFKQVKVVYDYYNISLNEKKMQTALFSCLQKIVDEKLLTEFSSLQESIFRFFDKLNSESEFPIDYSVDTTMQTIFKNFGLRWTEDDTDNLLSALVSFVQLFARVAKIKCFVFIGLKSYLSEEQLSVFYNEIALEDISLLLIENKCGNKLANEIVTVCDKDFCQFLA